MMKHNTAFGLFKSISPPRSSFLNFSLHNVNQNIIFNHRYIIVCEENINQCIMVVIKGSSNSYSWS